MKKLLLFDIDGTLIRPKNRIGYTLTFAVFEELLGIAVPPDHPAWFAGKTDLQIYEELAAELGADAETVEQQRPLLRDALARRFANYATPEWMELLPGATELVNTLAQKEDAVLGLVTGNVRPCAYLKLRSHGLEKHFTFGAFGCEHADRNVLPPLAVQRAEELTGLRFAPEDTVVIGDAVRDIDCAKAHGMKVVAVATGGTPAATLHAHGADVVFEDFLRTDEVCAAMLS